MNIQYLKYHIWTFEILCFLFCYSFHKFKGDLILCLFSLLSDFRQIRNGISMNYTFEFPLWHFSAHVFYIFFWENLKRSTVEKSFKKFQFHCESKVVRALKDTEVVLKIINGFVYFPKLSNSHNPQLLSWLRKPFTIGDQHCTVYILKAKWNLK